MTQAQRAVKRKPAVFRDAEEWANVVLFIAPAVQKKTPRLRRNRRCGPSSLVWYQERYCEIGVSASGVRRVFTRNNLGRLVVTSRVRSIVSKRYERRMKGCRYLTPRCSAAIPAS